MKLLRMKDTTLTCITAENSEDVYFLYQAIYNHHFDVSPYKYRAP